jgi:hypothetical protein
MKKNMLCATVIPALLILGLAAGCSKTQDTKADLATNGNGSPKQGADVVGPASSQKSDIPLNAGGAQGDAGSNPPVRNGSDLVGKYGMQIELPQIKASASDKAKMEQMIKDRLASYGLELKEDGTFLITGEQNVEGTWQAGPGTVTLNAKTVDGKPVGNASQSGLGAKDSGMSDKPQTLTVEDGGKTLRPIVDKDSKHGKFWFTKKG